MRSNKYKKIGGRLILAGALLFTLMGFVVVSALIDDERANLQAELNSLENELNNNGYSWLVDYTLSGSEGPFPKIEIYEKDSLEKIASFESLADNQYNKVYLSNLEGEQDVFDLLVKNGEFEKMDYKILQKKIRIDEIRKILNEEDL